MWLWSRSHGPRWPHRHMGMDQYLLIPFLGGWTSIYQLFWCSPGVLLVLTHCHIWCLASGPVRSSFCRSQANKRCSCSKKSRSCSNNWVWCWADRAESFCHVSMVSSKLLVPSCHETMGNQWFGVHGDPQLKGSTHSFGYVWLSNVAASSIKEFVELATEQPWAFPSPGTWV